MEYKETLPYVGPSLASVMSPTLLWFFPFTVLLKEMSSF